MVFCLTCCPVSASSVAVVDCAGALAELHPAAFISNFIPRLKAEMFSGKKKAHTNKYVYLFDSQKGFHLLYFSPYMNMFLEFADLT